MKRQLLSVLEVVLVTIFVFVVNGCDFPTDLKATASSPSQVNLSWNAADGDVVGYKIYVNGVYLKSVPELTASHADLAASTEYCYTVSAYDADNNESAQSNQACATTFPPVYEPFEARVLPLNRWPHNLGYANPLPTGDEYGSDGIKRVFVNGTLYDQPVSQCQYILSLLSSYRHNSDPEYLRLARVNADRLLSYSISSRGALYFPFSFDYTHSEGAVLHAPWYSAMAQGLALSVFTRLYIVTQDERYLTAAQGTFQSFKNTRTPGMPWVVNFDAEGYLLFEEYPNDEHPDLTFNGHWFGIVGLFDYYHFSKDADALTLYRMGVSAWKRYVEDIRVKGWVSLYCLHHKFPAGFLYHDVHIGQLYKLYEMTGDSYFATVADAFLEDYPNPLDHGTGKFAAGSYDAYQFEGEGTITGQTSITLSAAETPAVGMRRRMKDQPGIWLRVDSGSLSGYWISENPNTAYIMGWSLQSYIFDLPRVLQFQEGSYTGYVYDRNGVVTSSKTVSMAAGTVTNMIQRVLVNGRTHFLVSTGELTGFWVAAEERLSFKGAALRKK